ncbi:site-specific integrase [Paenibacillus durus]|uniref:site-specific integrase n=1 Tax=Paenibacillus durus TaxID=44251 RepID=UPI002E81E95B|nr:site-specific integrase [Paenibacillus durus]
MCKEEIPKYLEKESLAKLLETAKEKGLKRDFEIFTVLAYSGMRADELCALKWSDVDFEENRISITKTTYSPRNNHILYKLHPPKTKNSIRTIEMDEEVMSILKKYRTWQNEFRMRHKDIYHEGGFVFATVNKHKGYPELVKQIDIRIDRLLKLSGLNQELTPHSLRHTHTSLLAESGVSLEQIMDRLGHGDDEVTKLIYLHVTKPRKKRLPTSSVN